MERLRFDSSSEITIYILHKPKSIRRQDAWKACVAPHLPQGDMIAAFLKEFQYLTTDQQLACFGQEGSQAVRIREQCTLEIQPKKGTRTRISPAETRSRDAQRKRKKRQHRKQISNEVQATVNNAAGTFDTLCESGRAYRKARQVFNQEARKSTGKESNLLHFPKEKQVIKSIRASLEKQGCLTASPACVTTGAYRNLTPIRDTRVPPEHLLHVSGIKDTSVQTNHKQACHKLTDWFCNQVAACGIDLQDVLIEVL
jgi:hypothetical protein